MKLYNQFVKYSYNVKYNLLSRTQLPYFGSRTSIPFFQVAINSTLGREFQNFFRYQQFSILNNLTMDEKP